MRESYNSVEGVYRRAKARGMDLVTITDHDTIDGALLIADRPDVIVGCEVTACSPATACACTSACSACPSRSTMRSQRRRHDVGELLPYLRQERLFTSINHVASRINGPITAAHIAALLPWIDGVEIRNGSRMTSQNRTAAALAAAHGKVGIGGSDSHTGRGIGRTWIEAPARDQRATRSSTRFARVASPSAAPKGSYFAMASDICRMATGFYADRVRRLIASPADWRRHAMLLGGLLGLPLIAVPLAVALGHFILEDRFNRDLLVDLVARPSLSNVPATFSGKVPATYEAA